MSKHTAYQQKVIKRYYDQADNVGYQQLSELVTEIYLAEGKKADALWKRVEKALAKVQIDEKMRQHVLETRDPAVLANVLKQIANG
jgi:hypothetical protein